MRTVGVDWECDQKQEQLLSIFVRATPGCPMRLLFARSQTPRRRSSFFGSMEASGYWMFHFRRAWRSAGERQDFKGGI